MKRSILFMFIVILSIAGCEESEPSKEEISDAMKTVINSTSANLENPDENLKDAIETLQDSDLASDMQEQNDDSVPVEEVDFAPFNSPEEKEQAMTSVINAANNYLLAREKESPKEVLALTVSSNFMQDYPDTAFSEVFQNNDFDYEILDNEIYSIALDTASLYVYYNKQTTSQDSIKNESIKGFFNMILEEDGWKVESLFEKPPH